MLNRVPVVIGATNIKDWAVAPNSMLVMESKEVTPWARMWAPASLMTLHKFCKPQLHKHCL